MLGGKRAQQRKLNGDIRLGGRLLDDDIGAEPNTGGGGALAAGGPESGFALEQNADPWAGGGGTQDESRPGQEPDTACEAVKTEVHRDGEILDFNRLIPQNLDPNLRAGGAGRPRIGKSPTPRGLS